MRLLKAFFSASVLAAAFSLSASAGCPAVSFPSEVSIGRKIKVLGVGEGFVLSSGRQKVGKISEQWTSVTNALGLTNLKNFTFYDANGAKVSAANEAAISIGKRINISDCEGKSVGTIQENIFKSLLGFGVTSSYSILNENGKEIGRSEKTEWLTARLKIKDNSGNVIAEINRSTSFLTHAFDGWTIKVLNPKAFDARFAAMIVAYKASADLERENKK